VLVVACDRLFEPTYEGPCGGAAEAAAAHLPAGFDTIVERFDASPRTVITIYGRAAGR
jgi:hypothetical protein